jgi:Ca-activated chloride channel family protein
MQDLNEMQKYRALPASKKRAASMRRRLLSLAIAIFLSVPAGAGPQAQQPALPAGAPQQGAPAQNQRPPRITVRANYVIVPVTVKDGSGRLIGDLRKEEFRVFCDNVEQEISSFSSDPVPLSAVVLIDDDLPDRAVKQVQKSLAAIAAGFGQADEVALVKYAQYPNTVADFSYSNDKLFTQLKRMELGSHPTQTIIDPTTVGTAINGQPQTPAQGLPRHGSKRSVSTDTLHDAIYAAAEMLKERGRDRRKIIFLISDGSNSSHNVHTFEETLRALLAADISVYSISITRSVPIAKSLLQRGASELDKYATDTGGDTFFGSKQRDLERLYSDLTEQARNQYTLTFAPQEIRTDQDYHTIEVRVRRPGLRIAAREGYYQSAIGAGR